MKTKKGFTLLELVVVVLIIGVLAAIALPQYKKAVERSKAMQALVLLKMFADAEERFYVANGQYTKSLEELDISLPAGYRSSSPVFLDRPGDTTSFSNGEWSLEFLNTVVPGEVNVYRSRGPYAGAGFSYFFQYSQSQFRGHVFCREIKVHGYPNFSKPAGSYCAKIMHGTPTPGYSSDSDLRCYTLLE